MASAYWSCYEWCANRPLLVLIVAAPVMAQGTYTQIDVPGSTGTYCYGISGAGDIVGIYSDTSGNQHGFLLSGGTYSTQAFTTVNYPGAIATFPSAINDSGAITGFTISGNGVQVGFEKVGGKYKAIEPPGTSNAQMYRR